jgi:hypothetical protein
MRSMVRRIVPTMVMLFLTLVSTTGAGEAMRCTTVEQPSMRQLYTVCSDGTWATATWSPSLRAWQTPVTPPPGQTCTGRLNSRTRQWEGTCR